MSDSNAYLKINVTTGSKIERIEKFNSEGLIKVRVKAKPIQGKANEAIIKLISKSLGIPTSKISIKTGKYSRNKTVEIDGYDIKQIKKLIEQLSNHDP